MLSPITCCCTRPRCSPTQAAKGAEPELTTKATQDADGAMGKPSRPFPFVDTIDYIFTNDGDGRAAAWAVKAVGSLPSKAEAAAICESYPTADEPSDHLLLWADLSL